MSLRDCKEIAEAALKVIRVIAAMPPRRQMEVMAVAQTMVNIEAQRTLSKSSPPRTPPPEDEEDPV